MNDMSTIIVAKSDQLNSDDLISGPRTIHITGVKVTPGTEQPCSIFFAGDNKKPWKPCKSMARVLVAAWGPDANAYAGRSLTLYRDAGVTWGGMAVGGIRIGAMTHIQRDLVMALTEKKGSKKLFTVKVLKEAMGKAPAADEKRPEMWPLMSGPSEVIEVPASKWLARLDDMIRQTPPEFMRDFQEDMRPHLASIAASSDDGAEAARKAAGLFEAALNGGGK